MVDDYRGLLLSDNLNDLADEFFGIVAEQSELPRTQALKNPGGSPTRKIGAFGNLTDKVIFDR